MSHRSAAFVLTTLIGCASAGASRADDVTELATLKGNGAPVNWIALSADGTRLAVARANVKGKIAHPVRIPAEFEIWDVDSGTKICSGKNAKADFTFVMFSANGKTLVTVDEGFNHAGGNVAVRGGLRTRGKSGYQAWDSTTGREIGSAIVPARHGEFTTAAVSPDGKYLATVYNEQYSSGKLQPSGRFAVREVTVWDLNSHKARWNVKGSPHTGRVIWSDSLAFSPDGIRLAFYLTGSGGPSSEAASAPAGRPPGAIDPLRLLTLEAGKETPTVAVLARPNAKSGSIEWISSGEFLFVREGRAIEALDPATGKSRGSFALSLPRPAPPNPSGKAFPLPRGRPNNTSMPENWHEPQTAPSADGSRFAASFFHEVAEKQLRENRIFIWDVPGRKVLGTIELPDDVWVFGANRVPTKNMGCIALSGNGGRLAVSGFEGTVRIYDVSKISGTTKPTPGAGSALTAADAAAIRDTYQRSVARAREVLLGKIDLTIGGLENNRKSNPKKVEDSIARLKDRRARFEKSGMVPWTKETWSSSSGYLDLVAEARAELLASYAGEPVPDDVRDLIDKQVVARWKYQPGNRTITLYSSGKLNDPAGAHTWTFSKGRLSLSWKDNKAPGGYWVDRCDLAPDGLSYAGFNQTKVKISGTLIRDD